jgi:hypothetical protein
MILKNAQTTRTKSLQNDAQGPLYATPCAMLYVADQGETMADLFQQFSADITSNKVG